MTANKIANKITSAIKKITKITKLLYNIPDKVPKFINKIWIEVYDQSGNADDRYKPNKQIRFKTSMLQSDLCNYSDEYFNVDGTIAVAESNNDAYDKKLALKDNAPFIGCISNVNSVFIVMQRACVMPMYNLTEYNKKLFIDIRNFIELL